MADQLHPVLRLVVSGVVAGRDLGLRNDGHRTRRLETLDARIRGRPDLRRRRARQLAPRRAAFAAGAGERSRKTVMTEQVIFVSPWMTTTLPEYTAFRSLS